LFFYENGQNGMNNNLQEISIIIDI